MCNQNQNPNQPQQTAPQQPAGQKAAPDRELELARINLEVAVKRSDTAFNLSAAGQIQRQFEAMQRCAKPYAESTIVPTSYRGNIGNCVIALDLSHRMNLPAITVMQNLYIVNGNPSWSSKFLVASINTCGRFTNIRYRKRSLGTLGKVKYNSHEWVTRENGRKEKTIVVREYDATGIENWECVAFATEKATGEVLESDPVTIEMAIKEGWYTKDGSKWQSMPMLMLSYRAAAFWQRVYAPEISMGFRTVEEERDIQDVEYEEIPFEESEPRPAKTARPTGASVEAAKEKLRARQQTAASAAKTEVKQDKTFDMP